MLGRWAALGAGLTCAPTRCRLFQDADIIVLEFAFNDNYPGISLLSPPRGAYEQV